VRVSRKLSTHLILSDLGSVLVFIARLKREKKRKKKKMEKQSQTFHPEVEQAYSGRGGLRSNAFEQTSSTAL
jgi:hypothetical protein